MKLQLLDLLICPACLPHEVRLSPRITTRQGNDILCGSLHCPQCGAIYPVEEGIAAFIPRAGAESMHNRYETTPLVSAYLWSHYADLLDDPEAGHAYRDWSGLIREHSGLALDAGCAVGRLTFEMAAKSDFAIGIDNSRAFIQTARTLLTHGRLSFQVPEEGVLQKTLTVYPPHTWKPEQVEFIVGDIQCLPFASRHFSVGASLNLIDKVPRPLKHLQEMNRVARARRAQFLFSDPFSWSEDIAPQKHWLGGTREGHFSGRGMDNMVYLLTGHGGHLSPPWRIDATGHIWWKIRNHCNHFELIRSGYIKAER